jgi:hypothetical protein
MCKSMDGKQPWSSCILRQHGWDLYRVVDVPSQGEMGSQVGTPAAREDEYSRKRKRCEEGSMTATQEKMVALRKDFPKLKWEHRMQKTREAASQGTIGAGR